MRPEPRDVAYYARLINDHHPRLHLNSQTALSPPATKLPVTGANQIAAQPDADRYRAELTEVLGEQQAKRIGHERAWPAVIGALGRAEDNGQHSHEALRRALAQRDLDGLNSMSAVLAWRLDHQTRLITHDPTHTGQAWPAIAWTLRAWETHKGSDAAYLVDALAPGRGLDNLAIAIAHTTTETINRDAKEANPTGLPRLAYPAHVLDSNAAEDGMHEFATDLAAAIRGRTDALTETALTDRPEWTQAFGPEPADPTEREARETALRLAAAHRDQPTSPTTTPPARSAPTPPPTAPDTANGGHQPPPSSPATPSTTRPHPPGSASPRNNTSPAPSPATSTTPSPKPNNPNSKKPSPPNSVRSPPPPSNATPKRSPLTRPTRRPFSPRSPKPATSPREPLPTSRSPNLTSTRTASRPPNRPRLLVQKSGCRRSDSRRTKQPALPQDPGSSRTTAADVTSCW